MLQVCWLLIRGDGEESGYVVGGWVEEMLWDAEMFEDLHGAKADSGLKLRILG